MTAIIVPGTPMRRGWLQSPTHDAVMAFIWLPFAVAAHVVAGDPERLRWLVSATLVFSFAHQPLTLWLAYGDSKQRAAHATLFAWAPPVVVLAVALGSSLRPELVALVAGVWNVGHTIRQRYGISRLYGRLRGVDCGSDNRLLWSWLAVAVLVAVGGSDLGATARDLGLGSRSRTAIEALASANALTVVLLPAAIAIALYVTTRSVVDERRRQTHSPARFVYLGSTALLLVVLAVEPVTGFVAYVGAHAAEYLLVVRWRIDRAADRATSQDHVASRDHVASLARRVGGIGTLGLYAGAVVLLTAVIRTADGSGVALIVVLTLGALHLLYDGFIWRSPAEARVRTRGLDGRDQ